MAADTPELGIGRSDASPDALDGAHRDWLARHLREDAGAPLVPVSALDRALHRVGASFTGLRGGAPDLDELLGSGRRRLFPPARVKAIHRWLRTFLGDEAEPDDAAAAEALLTLLRRLDPLSGAGARHPVLREVLSASFDAARRVERLQALHARIGAGGWPFADEGAVSGLERGFRRLPVRVAPVDLLRPLREEYARAGARRRAARPASSQQLSLIDARARPLVGRARLTRAGRDATADALDAWLAASSGPADAVALARSLRDRLRGGPGDDDAVDALVRASALDIFARCSAAELTRLEAALVADGHDVEALLDYGDYLARAWRSDEAVRAYQLARDIAPPAERPRIDDRIAGREERLAGPPPRRRRSPPDQLPLRF